MKSLLIVEDEKIIRKGIRAMVSRSSVPVETIYECSNGEKAMELLQSTYIEVMITDIQMPIMNGIELVKRAGKLKNPPIMVAVSGYDDFSYAVDMLRSGVRDYLLKPIEREKLASVLASIEEELAGREQTKRENLRISLQLLKHILVDPYGDSKEMDVIFQRYQGSFFFQGYYVCAGMKKRESDTAETEDIEMAVNENIICIPNIQHCDICIVSKEKQSFMEEEWMQRYYGVSSLHQEIRELHQAYSEAVAAREWSFLHNRTVTRFDEIKEEKTLYSTDAEQFTGLNEKQQRVLLLGTNRKEEFIQNWSVLFKAAAEGELSYYAWEECIQSFLIELRKKYSIMLSDVEEETQIEKPLLFSCLQEYENQFMAFLLALYEQIDANEDDDRNIRKMQQAIAYIEKNYHTDLNMAVVSNEVSMNYSLFSIAFKQYTGENFVNYLKDIRIKEAKKLLAETDYRIIEISHKVGYENEKHFMKVFRTACGVSPSEYRRTMMQTEQEVR